MAIDHFRQVGSFSTAGGGLELQFQSRPPLSSVPLNMSVTRDPDRNLLLQEEVHTLLQKGAVELVNRPSSYSRFLFPPISCSKEKWGNETCDRPLRPESASNSAAFQDGDQQIYQGFNSFRYVDNVSRFDRRLFPYSYFPQVPQVLEICLGRQCIRFQDDAF